MSLNPDYLLSALNGPFQHGGLYDLTDALVWRCSTLARVVPKSPE